MFGLKSRHTLVVGYFPVRKLLNILVLISLLFSNFGISQAKAKSSKTTQNTQASSKLLVNDTLYTHPSPRTVNRSSASSTRSNQIRDSFDVLTCGTAPTGTTCEIIDPGKHLRFISTVAGFNGPYGFDFYAHALPSNVDMPISWRAIVSHSESGIYPLNEIADYLSFYAITGSTYYQNLIATTSPGYYVLYNRPLA